MEHPFTAIIKEILENKFEKISEDIFEKSQLIQYINEKTRSANRGSKSRASFANLYAIYVIIEDYLAKEFEKREDYSDYEGASFSQLFARQRELPFGEKLQNHALNNRMNAEFEKYFPNTSLIPILRNHETNRYWINENLLKFTINNKAINLAESIIEIIDTYIKTKQDAFQRFIQTCEKLQTVDTNDKEKIEEFIMSLLAPNVDARLFEIVSFAILKYHYHEQTIIWGFEIDNLTTENLKLFKTGRTNANDGGIDFVMKPLGHFFQVTETLDFKKYFLDIDKIQKYPITFVVKSDENIKVISQKIETNALKTYPIKAILEKYLACIEEIINITILKEYFSKTVKNGHLNNILNEILEQSKTEFNYSVNDDEAVSE